MEQTGSVLEANRRQNRGKTVAKIVDTVSATEADVAAKAMRLGNEASLSMLRQIANDAATGFLKETQIWDKAGQSRHKSDTKATQKIVDIVVGQSENLERQILWQPCGNNRASRTYYIGQIDFGKQYMLRQNRDKKHNKGQIRVKHMFFDPLAKRKTACKTLKNGFTMRFLRGADDQIRTGDLVLTKDALCLLSYTSTAVLKSC